MVFTRCVDGVMVNDGNENGLHKLGSPRTGTVSDK